MVRGNGMLHKCRELYMEPGLIHCALHSLVVRHDCVLHLKSLHGPSEIFDSATTIPQPISMASSPLLLEQNQESIAGPLPVQQPLSSDEPSEHVAGKQVTKMWYRAWLLEITAIGFSTFCLIGIYIFLLRIDGKPYDKWKIANVNITPNVLLSIFSALSKSSLLLILAKGIGQL